MASTGSLGWPFPMLKYEHIFQIKYTEAVLSDSTRKLLWFEVTKTLIANLKKNYCVFYYIFRHTVSVRCDGAGTLEHGVRRTSMSACRRLVSAPALATASSWSMTTGVCAATAGRAATVRRASRRVKPDRASTALSASTNSPHRAATAFP